MRTVKFAWLPVRLWHVVGRYWEPTGRRVWLTKVEQVETRWGDRYFVEVRQ